MREMNLERGLTLGMRQILAARKVVLVASGEKKACIIKRLLKGPPGPQLPASLLNNHLNSYLFLDEAAYSLTKKSEFD